MKTGFGEAGRALGLAWRSSSVDCCHRGSLGYLRGNCVQFLLVSEIQTSGKQVGMDLAVRGRFRGWTERKPCLRKLLGPVNSMSCAGARGQLVLAGLVTQPAVPGLTGLFARQTLSSEPGTKVSAARRPCWEKDRCCMRWVRAPEVLRRVFPAGGPRTDAP